MSTAATSIQQHHSSAFHQQHHHSAAIDRIIDSPIAKHVEQDAIRQALWQPIVDLDVHAVLANLPLPEGIRRRDIAVSTDVQLERTKDQDDVERNQFASEIAYTIGSELQKAGYSGTASNASYELSVVVTTASAGSARGRILAGDLGYGHAKLALVYCLTESGCCTDTTEFGQVLKAGRIRKTDSFGEGWDDLVGIFEKGNVGNKKLLKNIVPDTAREISETVGL
eukprot:CAMPEP_0197719670 /NCGR_PEP_ID=MMETSP1434-20131217/3332_1 /TAXON_ID=265543 /ORGANISM="Minutocellus polymorphus, Strain CCMP3303" /LENGTH=224 /DNA_ID=CAMNT_0043304437 /DNA_START=78 /DNA_END=752 /DNA_ORIENTATION=+